MHKIGRQFPVIAVETAIWPESINTIHKLNTHSVGVVLGCDCMGDSIDNKISNSFREVFQEVGENVMQLEA